MTLKVGLFSPEAVRPVRASAWVLLREGRMQTAACRRELIAEIFKEWTDGESRSGEKYGLLFLHFAQVAVSSEQLV